MPLPSQPAARGDNSRRSRRTPSIDNSVPAGASPSAPPALVADTATVPGVPSGRRTIRHGTPRTRRRPSTASRTPHNGCAGAVTVTASGADDRNSRSLCCGSSRAARPTSPTRRGCAGSPRRGCCARASCRPKPIRELRHLTRYRKTQIPEREREVNRLHKALEDAGIKLDCVAADIMGKSGRDMLDALVAGTTDPDVLAELARRQMRKKIPALREALEGHFDAHHALLDRRDPRAHRLPRRADRPALGRDRGAAAPFRAGG